MKNIVLAGSPNVGKSVLFYQLTGNYVTVSNYPGTTVEVARGRANISGRLVNVYDTPGMYSLSPVTEEESVTRRLLLDISPTLVVHVVDAKNLPRMLPLTLELLSCGFCLLLVLNMMDEAEAVGVSINRAELAARLGIPVVEAVLAEGRGLNTIKKEILHAVQGQGGCTPLLHQCGCAETRISASLEGAYPLPRQIIGRFILEGDAEIIALVKERESAAVYAKCREAAGGDENLAYQFALGRWECAKRLLAGVFQAGRGPARGNWLDMLTLDPAGGFFVMVFVLYAGLYLLVGKLGAGVLVDILEGTLFGKIIVPMANFWVESYIPWQAVRELLAQDYGILTLGFRYAFGVILPIVGTFFFMFSLLEDSGYLPRLALLADSAVKRLGLNGRAVIPLTLGFGCGTMAVVVTRILENRRERFVATLLLALAVPCSAQLGLILSILSAEPYFLFIWICVVGGVFMFTGTALNILLPGGRAAFLMEMPPLRAPKLNAIFQKTLARLRWYFLEVIPVFILVSFVLWLLRQTGGLEALEAWFSPVLGQLGLPPELGIVFILGFFRRDYGAAGLFDFYRLGSVSGAQLLVAAVVLTLFLPCLAQLAMMVKERGPVAATVIASSVTVIAFCTGVLLRVILRLPVL